MKLVVLGLSITSSWGNGHATTYRGLLREMARRGHEVLFLERDVPWYAANRDLAAPPFCRTVLYRSPAELFREYGREIVTADCVMVGSYVPDGIEIGGWVTRHARGVTAFYDIDTPVTLAKLESDSCTYLSRDLVSGYRLYLSFTGGPILDAIERTYRSPAARPLYCSVDPEVHFPMQQALSWDLGYLGTYSIDRQPGLERLLCIPATQWQEGSFIVAGAQFPPDIRWPENTERIEHISPENHSSFYNAQRFTLNITRKQMIRVGHSPSVRLFEAAACGVPVISDHWPGLERFFVPGEEILLASTPAEVLYYLRELSEADRRGVGERARNKVLAAHSAAARAKELETYLQDAG
jgi:spore maturation protein CgeB